MHVCVFGVLWVAFVAGYGPVVVQIGGSRG
jgi:hypothetical protein